MAPTERSEYEARIDNHFVPFHFVPTDTTRSSCIVFLHFFCCVRCGCPAPLPLHIYILSIHPSTYLYLTCNINRDFSFPRMSFAIKQLSYPPCRAMNEGIHSSSSQTPPRNGWLSSVFLVVPRIPRRCRCVSLSVYTLHGSCHII